MRCSRCVRNESRPGYKTCESCAAKNRASIERWRLKHPDKADVFIRRWMKAHPEKIKVYRRKQNLRKYGITPEQFDALLASQGGVCALFEVCGSREPGGSGEWHVDHDHETGRIRGLLCTCCNTSRVGMNNLASALVLVRYFTSPLQSNIAVKNSEVK